MIEQATSYNTRRRKFREKFTRPIITLDYRGRRKYVTVKEVLLSTPPEADLTEVYPTQQFTADWARFGNCANQDSAIRSATTAEEQQSAKVDCKDCPVLLECLAVGLSSGSDGSIPESSIYGSLTERERKIRLGRGAVGIAQLRDQITTARSKQAKNRNHKNF